MSNCRGCGKEIIWGVNLEGKKIPLDPAPPVYVSMGNTGITNGMVVTRDPDAMVSHFATCPEANEFSGSKKAKP